MSAGSHCWKSYSYIENITFQYLRLLQAPAELIHRKTFYLADYEPIDLLAWCDAFQRALDVRADSAMCRSGLPGRWPGAATP